MAQRSVDVVTFVLSFVEGPEREFSGSAWFDKLTKNGTVELCTWG